MAAVSNRDVTVAMLPTDNEEIHAAANDIAILINRKFPQTVSEVLQTALCTVQQWCEKTKLSINPNKTVVITFTRKRNVKGLICVTSSSAVDNKISQLPSLVKCDPETSLVKPLVGARSIKP
jgi:hypothetical protein